MMVLSTPSFIVGRVFEYSFFAGVPVLPPPPDDPPLDAAGVDGVFSCRGVVTGC